MMPLRGIEKTKKTKGLLMSSLFLVSMLKLAFNIQPVNASGTVYIRADGTVYPTTAPVLNVGNVSYTLTADIIYDSIVVERDNIALDGAGYTVQGTGSGTGINLTGRKNVTIKNVQIKAFEYGIYLSSSLNNSISGNNVTNNSRDGIRLYSSSNYNIISGNNITNNDNGIFLLDSSNSGIFGNNVTNNDESIYLLRSSNNSISGNNVTNTLYGITLSECFNNSIFGNDITNNWYGIGLSKSSNSSIFGNDVTNNRDGIWIDWSSSYNIISGNDITDNNQYGISLKYSSNNKISGNDIINNFVGVYLSGSSSNKFAHNNFIENTHQVYIQNAGANSWDDGYPSGGNYWSDYIDVDLYGGPYQNEPGSDGVWDHSYVIDVNNQDRYPRVTLWMPTPPPPTPAIYIRADGSVDPPSAPISSVDNVTYTLTDDINEPIWLERDNIVLDGAGYTVQGTGSGTGIGFLGRKNVTIKNVQIKAFDAGIGLGFSSNCSISGNNITNNGVGIVSGVASNFNSIYGNKVTNNELGIVIFDSSNNIISGNNASSNNNTGILLAASGYNTVSGNTVSKNIGWAGIELAYSNNNSIHHNNFINNTNQIRNSKSNNTWDDGYPSGGNYWSDYVNADLYSGLYQNETGNDGIGDATYSIDGNNQDRYPLMQPYRGPVRNLNTGQSYPTIQEGINDATEGDTILALSGTYYERVTINKNNLTLVGENRNTTIIDGNGTIYACVHLFYSRYVGISEFSIRNGYWGIYLDHAQANDISDNEVTNNKIGVRLFNSDNNRVTGNVVTNNSEGITIGFSTNNTLVNNTISNNTGNFGVYGRYLSHFIHDIDTSNRVNGKPVYYLTKQHNLIINSTTFPQIGYLGLINSTNITVKDINCNGILFAYTNNSRIQNVNASSGVSGVFLVHSFENIISGNSLANNCDGVKVYALPSFPTPFCNNTIVNNVISDNDRGIILDSSGNTIVNNTITSNEGIGVYLYYCEKNVLKGNKMLDNKYGILVEGGRYNNVTGNFVSLNDDGIFLDDACNNIIDGNLISQNGYGIYSWDSQNNIVRGNTLSNNHEGISLSYYSDYNAIYHNNFLDNAFQARALDSITTWDDSYPSGGNYWSDYAGVDLYSGPYQNETGSDGIGDTPYEIDEYNRDNYPLMNPWPPTPPSPVIAAIVDIDPDTLNLKSKGKWITCYISFPIGYNVTDINVDTILLNETIPAERSDIQDNVLMVKFKRADVADFIIESLGKTYGDVTLTVTGELTDGTPFEDSYTFRVICPVNHPVNLDKVRVVDCNGNSRNGVEEGGQVFIEAALNNTTPVPENVTVIFEVIDGSGLPVGRAVVQGSFSTNLTVLTLMLTIPEWASTGTATVYINAYKDPPWANGIPYCPETSTTITLQQA